MEHYLAVAKRMVIVSALLLGFGAAAAAQGELGTITGTLKDAQGGVMPGVTATAVNARDQRQDDRHHQRVGRLCAAVARQRQATV